MFRCLLIITFLSGCTVQHAQMNESSHKEEIVEIAEAEQIVDAIGVVSIIGDELLCTHTGVTVFSNEQQRYLLPKDLNQLLTQRVVKQFTNEKAVLKSLDRQSLSFINDDIGPSQWSNIKLRDQQNIELLLIYSGSFEYRSKDGYYAEDNALNTNATSYLYELSSGELIGQAEHYQYDLKKQFSCTQNKFPVDNEIYSLIKKAGQESQDVVIKEAIKSLISKTKP